MPDTRQRKGKANESGMHLDGDKARISDTVAIDLLYEAGLIFAQNNKPREGYPDGKYPDINGVPNFKSGIRVSRLADSIMRHWILWMAGEDFDRDSGFRHLAHMICNISMAHYQIENNSEMDDREGAALVSTIEDMIWKKGNE